MLVPCLFTLLTACGSSSPSADASAPPVLTDVTLDKTQLRVGVVETIQVTVSYTDADGDVAHLEQQIASQAPESVDMPGAAGQKHGTQAFMLAVGAPAAGSADLAFWLVDSRGNESAHVTRTLTAQ
jgi:hypothetical protein